MLLHKIKEMEEPTIGTTPINHLNSLEPNQRTFAKLLKLVSPPTLHNQLVTNDRHRQASLCPTRSQRPVMCIHAMI